MPSSTRSVRSRSCGAAGDSASSVCSKAVSAAGVCGGSATSAGPRTSASGKRKIPSSAVPEANSVSLSNCSIPFSLACPFSFLYAAADIKMSGSVDKPEKRWYNFKTKMKRYGGDAA